MKILFLKKIFLDPQKSNMYVLYLHELCAAMRMSRGAYCTLSCTSGSKDFHPTPALDIPDFHSQTTPFADPKRVTNHLQQKNVMTSKTNVLPQEKIFDE
jgi:hypothetical protein